VDHRFPRSRDPEGLHHHDWQNLFPACAQCNVRRGDKYPDSGGMLSPGEGIETELVQHAEASPNGLAVTCRFDARDAQSQQAVATAAELARLHDPDSTTTFRARANTNDLLTAIRTYYAEDVHPLEVEVLILRRKRAKGQTYAPADLCRAERALRAAVSRRAPYTMLVRSLVNSSLDDLFD
ncbi:MAG: HNH endonuclease, partial [Myxococcales bacterium]|nr:HNH endonuclease [Myxococcales bacterium]